MYEVNIVENENNVLITKIDSYTNLPVSFWLEDIMYFEVEKRLLTAHKADGTTVQYRESLSNKKSMPYSRDIMKNFLQNRILIYGTVKGNEKKSFGRVSELLEHIKLIE